MATITNNIHDTTEATSKFLTRENFQSGLLQDWSSASSRTVAICKETCVHVMREKRKEKKMLLNYSLWILDTWIRCC